MISYPQTLTVDRTELNERSAQPLRAQPLRRAGPPAAPLRGPQIIVKPDVIDMNY